MRSFSRTTNLDWFVSRVAKIVGNPCILVNTEHKILAVSRELRAEAPNRSENLTGDYISAEAIRELRRDRVFDRIAEAHHWGPMRSATWTCSRATAPSPPPTSS